ncbi:MAG: class I SAM-dependent rRNA methyltransferase [Bilophila sp.]
MQSLFMKKNEDRRLRAGHLWIFSNEVDVKRSPLTAFAPGEAVQVCDSGSRPIGAAYVNPASLIAARIVSRNPDEILNGDLIHKRLTRALSLRERLFAVPFYRLCHGEGDWLPGLVLDRYGDVFSAQITTAGMEAHKATLLEVLQELCKPSAVLFRNDVSVRTMENLPLVVETGMGDVPDAIDVLESGARFTVSLASGQKTGWFYDQRENRLAAARYAQGTSVLDAFCYAGAFGVLAAKAGATSVHFLDASKPALDLAQQNLAQNTAPANTSQPTECTGETIQGDALDTLVALRDAGRRFGVVCLDPPAFIKRKKDAEQGLTAYRRVNDLGLQLVEDGGILMSCSCSYHLEADALRRLLAQCAAKRGLNTQVLYQGFQGPDHPVHPSMPETAYLKAFALRVWKN